MINGSETNSFEFLDFLTLVGFVLQLINYIENQEQSNNDDIMRELQRQDKAYLEKILDGQNKILKLLEKSNSPNG